jgi:uncharacterized protein YutE (UPF0331/DUF86 family)
VVRQRIDRLLLEVDAIEARLPSVTQYLDANGDSLRHELEHRLLIALQSMLDVAAHVAVSEGVGRLDSYRDAIQSLVDLGVVDAETGRLLAGAAGMRNAIAHDYLAIDHARVYAALADLEVLKTFARQVWTWVEAS